MMERKKGRENGERRQEDKRQKAEIQRGKDRFFFNKK